jgi:hypothetical protein
MEALTVTPHEFEQAIAKACLAETVETVFAAGIEALRVALGENSPAFLPAIDRLCRRMRQFDRKAVVRATKQAVHSL